MKNYLLVLLSVSALVLSSCSKDDTAPVITITTPNSGDKVQPGVPFAIAGEVTDDEELAEIKIANNSITTFDTKTKHTLKNISLTLDQSQPKGPIQLNISASDKEGNSSDVVIDLIVE